MLDLTPLPRLAPPMAGLLTRLAALRGACAVDLGPERAVLSLAPDRGWPPGRPPGRPPGGPVLRVPVASDLGSFALYLETALIDALSDAVLPGWHQESSAALPLSWRAIAVVHHLAAGMPVGALDWTYGEIAESAPPAPDPTRICLALGWLGHTHVLALEISDAPDLALADLLIPDPVPSGLAAHPLDITLELMLPAGGLALAEAVGLLPGDVVLLPRAVASAIPVHAVISNTIGWSGSLSADGAFHPLSRLSKEHIMRDHCDEPDDAALTAKASQAAGLDDLGLDEPMLAELPVRLDIRLQSLSLPLSAFVGLAPGAVLELEADLSSALEILANGRTVGTGRLVQLDQRIGVQIERWRDR
ncbi:MAG: FliM/FliN family flagellar motor switch protein [Pseudomonadota bacterium]